MRLENFPRQNRSLPLQPGRCVHDVVGDLKQLFNSRSQVSRGLLDLWRLGRIAGEIASLGDDILARICDTVNELQQLLGGCLIHQCLSYVVSGHRNPMEQADGGPEAS